MERILELTGKPSDDEAASLGSPYADSMLQEIQLPQKAPQWKQRFAVAPTDAINLLRGSLAFDPNKRPSAQQAWFWCPPSECMPLQAGTSLCCPYSN